jgi:Zn-dependent M28 family amino/carboxypeptidase
VNLVFVVAIVVSGVIALVAGCTPSGEADDDSAGDPVATPADLMAQIDAARYEASVVDMAVERLPGSEGWQAVQDHMVAELQAAGLVVELDDYGTGINVIATLEGTTRADELVLVSAHYDHIAGCAGADDNASGLAAILEHARVLGERSFERTLVVASWDQEEWGKIGSEAWVDAAAARGDQIVASIVYDTFAYTCDEPECQTVPFGFELLIPDQAERLVDHEYRGDFAALFANEASSTTLGSLAGYAEQIDLLQISAALSDELIASGAAQDLQRSDHAPFWDAGYPAIFVTDTANYRNPNYHCMDGQDDPDTLDYPFAVDVVRAATATLAEDLVLETAD